MPVTAQGNMEGIPLYRKILHKAVKGVICLLLFFMFCTKVLGGTSFSCTFEYGRDCFLYQDAFDDFAWTIAKNESFCVQGYECAHLHPNTPISPGKAILSSGDLKLMRPSCLIFGYLMYGDKFGTLNVTVTDTNGTILSFMSGQSRVANEWTLVTMDILSAYNDIRRIVFEGTRLSTGYGDIAIDAVYINEDLCHDRLCPVWSDWTNCTQTCGAGVTVRHKLCTKVNGMYNSREEVDMVYCNTEPCTVDGNWGNWTDWTSCSVTCGKGIMTRSRSCDNPVPEFGGLPCTGDTNESTTCTQIPCPVDGGWASWRSWSKCAVVNEEVVRSRCRKCINPSPKHGGSPCPGESLQTEKCQQSNDVFIRKCRCRRRLVPEIKNFTKEELLNVMEETKEKLTVDKKKTSRFIRTKISAPDDRKSSIAMATMIAFVLLSIPVLFIISADVMNIPKYLKERKKKKRTAARVKENKHRQKYERIDLDQEKLETCRKRKNTVQGGSKRVREVWETFV